MLNELYNYLPISLCDEPVKKMVTTNIQKNQSHYKTIYKLKNYPSDFHWII